MYRAIQCCNGTVQSFVLCSQNQSKPNSRYEFTVKIPSILLFEIKIRNQNTLQTGHNADVSMIQPEPIQTNCRTNNHTNPSPTQSRADPIQSRPITNPDTNHSRPEPIHSSTFGNHFKPFCLTYHCLHLVHEESEFSMPTLFSFVDKTAEFDIIDLPHLSLLKRKVEGSQ
jgi:hypothetical protein